ARPMGCSLSQQPVGEPRVAREQRPVEIGADRAADAAALAAALAIVPETGDDASERLGTLVEHRPPGMVLEPPERLLLARERALEQPVADHPPVARVGLQREPRRAREVAPVAVPVEPAEQLVAAADGERSGAAGDCFPQSFALCGQIARDQRLLPVLAAA